MSEIMHRRISEIPKINKDAAGIENRQIID
jgi:hypothetical protein